ncbi:MAG: hypothetical protein WCF90_10600 [Methanomicrobiales archaeon]
MPLLTCLSYYIIGLFTIVEINENKEDCWIVSVLDCGRDPNYRE